MPKALKIVDLGDGDELRFEISERLSSGQVKLNIFTPEGRMGLTMDRENWDPIIGAIRASLDEKDQG